MQQRAVLVKFRSEIACSAARLRAFVVGKCLMISPAENSPNKKHELGANEGSA
jgi:hypothetical protein